MRVVLPRFLSKQMQFPYASTAGTFSRLIMSRSINQPYLSHEERTVADFRDKSLHQVIVDKVTPVNERINIYRLASEDKKVGIHFLPGQWLDVHIPGIKKAGGFTLTSTPQQALPLSDSGADEGTASPPFLELAVQKSPDNPPAAWLWQPPEDIVGSRLTVRVGGSFVWPPLTIDVSRTKNVVFVAGGVGINPLISILSHIHQSGLQFNQVRFLYSTKVQADNAEPSVVLFLPRLLSIFAPREAEGRPIKGRLSLFFTGAGGDSLGHTRPSPSPLDSIEDAERVFVSYGRIQDRHLLEAMGPNPSERSSTVYYVCGPPDMTDNVVQFLREQDGISPQQVLCEKWW